MQTVVGSGCYGDSVFQVASVSRFCMELCVFSTSLICPLSNLLRWKVTIDLRFHPTNRTRYHVYVYRLQKKYTPEHPAAPGLWDDPAERGVTVLAMPWGLVPCTSRELWSPLLIVWTPHLHTLIFNRPVRHLRSCSSKLMLLLEISQTCKTRLKIKI